MVTDYDSDYDCHCDRLTVMTIKEVPVLKWPIVYLKNDPINCWVSFVDDEMVLVCLSIIGYKSLHCRHR